MLAISVSNRQQMLRVERDQITQVSDEADQFSGTMFTVAVLLAIGSLVLVRTSARQQHDLFQAQERAERHQVAYQQMSNSIPVGFYTYRQGQFAYTNRWWDDQLRRDPDEPAMKAMQRGLLQEEFDELTRGLNSLQDGLTEFEMRFHLSTPDEGTRIYETRALPIFSEEGAYEHALGYILDVTQRESSRRQLEAKTREVQNKNALLSQAFADLESNFDAMVRSLVKAIEAKDPYTAGHSERVMDYSIRIGEKLGLDPHQMKILQKGTLIHDIGKIGVPDAILTKPDKLTEEEYDLIKLHPTIGANMVREIPLFEECVPIIMWHHERLNGSGYPDRLAGDDVPLLVRIAAIADTYDAMTSDRAYRRGLDHAEALRRLRKDAEDGILDERIVEVLADIMVEDGKLTRNSESMAA
jgi:putative nucleotidyltransferase with HDIG domain